MLRATCHVQTGYDKNAGVICAVVENVGEPLEELPPETFAYYGPGAWKQADSTRASLDGIDELFTEARAFTFVPVPS